MFGCWVIQSYQDLSKLVIVGRLNSSDSFFWGVSNPHHLVHQHSFNILQDQSASQNMSKSMNIHQDYPSRSIQLPIISLMNSLKGVRKWRDPRRSQKANAS